MKRRLHLSSCESWQGMRLLPSAIAWTVVALGTVAAPQLEADWLVLTDGTTIETDGEWQVKGSMVVFSMPKGGLASLRLSKVDLDASARISAAERERALAPPKLPVPEKKKATFIVTDADVSHGEFDEASAEAPTGESDSDAVDSENPLVVTTWDQRPAPDDAGLIITGTLRNQGSNTSGGIAIEATLYDADGIVIASESANLNARALAPQQRTTFRIDFADVFVFHGVDFTVTGQELAAPSAASGSGESGADDAYDAEASEGSESAEGIPATTT